MRKIIVVLLVVAITSVMLSGCSQKSKLDNIMEIVEKNNKYVVLQDKETSVCYLMIYGGYGIAMTVLVDADGKPITEWNR